MLREAQNHFDDENLTRPNRALDDLMARASTIAPAIQRRVPYESSIGPRPAVRAEFKKIRGGTR